MAEPWYLVDNIDTIDSPALLIYKERVQYNLDAALALIGDASRLRPHVKTHKSPEVAAMMLRAGIAKFKCATIAEAEMLGQCEGPDVLLAYQPAGPKIVRFLNLMKRYPSTHFSCLVDSEEAARVLAKDARNQNLEVDVFIDVNIGMNRTGVLPKEALALYTACKELQSIRVIGLHGYDGHINDTNSVLRKERADEAYGQLQQVEELLKNSGLSQPTLILGGSPTFGVHAKRKKVECSPGTFIFWDRNYAELFPDLPFLPAVLVVSRVVSVLNNRRLCLDLGHKSIAAENTLARRVHFLNLQTYQAASQSEEHLVVDTEIPHRYKIGDVFYGMPFHVCPTCALYDRATLVENGRVKEEWKIEARDRKISV